MLVYILTLCYKEIKLILLTQNLVRIQVPPYISPPMYKLPKKWLRSGYKPLAYIRRFTVFSYVDEVKSRYLRKSGLLLNIILLEQIS